MSGRATIVGVCGGFGRVFASILSRRGFAIDGIDLATHAPADLSLAGYRSLDCRKLDWRQHAAAEPGRVFLLCLPQEAVLAMLPALLPVLGERTLAIDILSVKSAVAAEFARIGSWGQYLSLHPMFGPTLEFAGRNVVSIPLRDGDRVDAFEQLLRDEGARVVRMTADEHDRGTAVTQVMVHAALVALGLAMQPGSSDAQARFDALATPPYRVLLAMVARLTSGDPSLYQHIQLDNPHAPVARAKLADALRRVADACEKTSDFDACFLDAAPADRESLATLATTLVEAARG